MFYSISRQDSCQYVPHSAALGEGRPHGPTCRRSRPSAATRRMRCAIARDAIEEAIAARIARRADTPLPSAPRARQKPKAAAKDAPKVARVVLPTQTAFKAMLYRAMRAQNLRKADLERRLGLHGPQVDRLLNPRHASRLDQIERRSRRWG